MTSRNFKLYLVIAICAAPVIASYLVYFFVRPDARTNYGDLIEPQRPMPALHLQSLDGRTVDAGAMRGKWLMLMVARGECTAPCKNRLYHLRQVRLTTGKDRDRIARVWLIPDREPLPTQVIREYDGTEMLRANEKEIAAWLDSGEPGGQYGEHIYMVDPLGNLMMRFPVDADPSKTKRDIAKLLRASRIG